MRHNGPVILDTSIAALHVDCAGGLMVHGFSTLLPCDVCNAVAAETGNSQTETACIPPAPHPFHQQYGQRPDQAIGGHTGTVPSLQLVRTVHYTWVNEKLSAMSPRLGAQVRSRQGVCRGLYDATFVRPCR